MDDETLSMFFIGFCLGAAVAGITVGFKYHMVSAGKLDCSTLEQEDTIVYNGSIDDYNMETLPTDLFMSSDSSNSGVMLLSWENIDVINGSEERFETVVHHDITCKDGEIQIEEYLEGSHLKTREPATERDYQ